MKPEKSSIRSSLQGTELSTLDPALFETLGGQLYYSLDSAANQSDIHTMIRTFQAAHLPSLGQCIPQSGAVISTALSGDSTTALAGPTNNEVWQVAGMSFQNGTLSAIKVSVYLWDSTNSVLVGAYEQSIAAGATAAYAFTDGKIIFDSNLKLRVVHEADITCNFAYSKVVQ